MKYRQLGKSEVKVSIVAQGSWEMAGNVWGKVDDSESIQTLRTAVEGGITLIDTAASYGAGKSETVVGMGLKGIRNRVVLATKCGATFNPAKNALDMDLTPAGIRREVEASLKRLQTDWIDIYQFHYPDPGTPLANSLGEMIRLKEEGKIRAIGLSNFNLELLKEARRYAQIDSMQVKYSMLNRENEALIRYCKEQNVGVITYGSIAGGMLSGAYKEPPVFEAGDRRKFFYPYFDEPLFSKCRKLVDVLEEIAESHGLHTADVAIHWVTHQLGVTASLVGAITPQQAKENAAAGDIQLTDADYLRITNAYDTYAAGILE